MAIRDTITLSLIGQMAAELTQLPEEDLPLIIEFVDYLKWRRQAVPQPSLSIVEMRAEARRRVGLLGPVPRAEVVARFQELTEEIRQEVIY